MLALPLLLAASAAAAAPAVSVDFALDPGHAAHLTLRDEAGALLFVTRTMDGQDRDGFGWLRDRDPTEGRVSAAVDELLLPAGVYVLEVEGPDVSVARPLISLGPGGTAVPVEHPAEATALSAWKARGEGTGFAWAPTTPGSEATSLPLGGDEWLVRAEGAGGWRAHARADSPGVRLRPPEAAAPREHPNPRAWVVRLCLLPLTLVFLGLGAAALVRLGRRRGAGIAALTAGLLALVPLAAVLGDPTSRLLMVQADFTDPPNSASLVWAIVDSLLHATDISDRFNWPEGHSWLLLGPSWLTYVLAAPVAALLGGVAAHNFGQWLCLALVGFFAWALARDRGARPAAALVAGVGATLAPILVSELDRMSLDRAGIFGVPLFLLCLDRAARDRGWRWPVFAGLALTAVLFSQVYYGLYLAAAAPFLVLPRLVGPKPLHRLARLAAVGAVALVTLLPWAIAAKSGLSETEYTTDDGVPLTALVDPWNPVTDEDVATWSEQYDPRRADTTHARPMDTARARLLTTIINANMPSDLFKPGATLGGGVFYWPLVLLALLLARRRGAVALGAWDVAVFLVFSLGPFWRTSDQTIGQMLPYHPYFLAVPGFDQLKHPQRFAFLAAAVSSVPLALGVSGVFERVGGRSRHAVVRGLRVLGALLGGVLLATLVIRRTSELKHFPGLTLPDSERELVATLDWSFPVGRAFPRPAALHGLARGPALVLPFEEPLPTPAYLGPVQARMPLVNGAPHGIESGDAGGRALSNWAESNGTLNRIAWLAGSRRPRFALGEPGPADDAELQAAGLRYVILYRAFLRAPELAPPLEAWMDARYRRAASADDIIVWELPR